MLPIVNRCLVIVRPKQPFFDWMKCLPDPVSMTPDEFEQHAGTYLLQEFEDDEEKQQVLEHFYDLMFEEMLSGWWTVEKDWPQNRDLPMFMEWFDCEFHSLVFDMVDDPLTRE